MCSAPWRSAACCVQLAGWPLFALVAAARLSRPGRSWLFELVDTWQLYLLAPWLLLAPLALWLRSPSLALLAGLSGLATLWSGRNVIGRGRGPGALHGRRLRVMTANVLGSNPSATGLVELIERTQPDLVALQEIRSRFAADLLEQLGQRLPYCDLQPHQRNSGAALLSRWPLAEVWTAPLAPGGHLSQRARVLVGEQPVQFFNIHLDTPFEIYPLQHRRALLSWWIRKRSTNLRYHELEHLLEMVAPLDGPTIVMGDFNSTAGSRPHRRLVAHLRDAFQEVGRGLGHTFPQPIPIHGLVLPIPLLRIDYAFFKGALEPLEARRELFAGSDHYAVVVDLALGADRGTGQGQASRSGEPAGAQRAAS